MFVAAIETKKEGNCYKRATVRKETQSVKKTIIKGEGGSIKPWKKKKKE